MLLSALVHAATCKAQRVRFMSVFFCCVLRVFVVSARKWILCRPEHIRRVHADRVRNGINIHIAALETTVRWVVCSCQTHHRHLRTFSVITHMSFAN